MAQPVTSKGAATVTFEQSLTSAVKRQAIDSAKANALDRYVAQFDSAKSRNYDLARNKIVSNLDDYVLSASILTETVDEELREYSVVVRAEINAPRFENALVRSSVMANTPTLEKSLMTFVFVARQQSAVQVFDDKVYQRADTENSVDAAVQHRQSTEESEQITSNSVALEDRGTLNASGQVKTTSTVTTGGSTTRKADLVTWDVTRADEVNTVMTGTFTSAGYEVVEAEYLGEVDLDAIRADYGSGDDLSSATLRNTVQGVQEAGPFRYLALGKLDVGLRDTDPASGLTRVFVTVSGKVLDVSARFPRTVGSVGPEQFAGIGPSETVARTNALESAAAAAAARLVDQLNARGVQ